ncbi:glycosyltransferase [Desulfovibrio sp. OttesenSCG-928-M16]|nr:glycosyltransferase [Desulfovibrio sp. OttesenSCG-928-M16]
MHWRSGLVSIMIPNFNHSRYLDECIQSALNQTYPDIEIILLDNQSTDNSLTIAEKYTDTGLRICRNVFNRRNVSYQILADSLSSGEFMLLLCADDGIHPDFCRRAVNIMRRHPNVGYVHGERDFMLEDGRTVALEPFFHCSFIAPGVNMMPIYMVTTIAHPTQGIFRRIAFDRIGGYEKEIDHMNADKSLWFYLSSVSDYAYIRDKMCRIRLASDTQTQLTVRNFQHPVLCHLTINEFVRYAERFGFSKVLERKEEALKKLAGECLAWCGMCMAAGDHDTALAYLYYARLLDRGLTSTSKWLHLMACLDEKRPTSRLDDVWSTDALKKRNYPPPEDFIRIDAATGDVL